MAREIDNSKPKGFATRILGELPTGLQKPFWGAHGIWGNNSIIKSI